MAEISSAPYGMGMGLCLSYPFLLKHAWEGGMSQKGGKRRRNDHRVSKKGDSSNSMSLHCICSSLMPHPSLTFRKNLPLPSSERKLGKHWHGMA